MTEQRPVFPVIIMFIDWELSAFDDLDAFLNESGCEEVDFLDGLEAIIDADGNAFLWDQRNEQFEVHPDAASISPAYARDRFHAHVDKKVAERSRLKKGTPSAASLKAECPPVEECRAMMKYISRVVQELDM